MKDKARIGRGGPRNNEGISLTTRDALDARPSYRNQAAQRILAVLDAFAGRVAPVTPAELGTRLGMSKNMIHRALVVLEKEGFVVRSATGKGYLLGPKILTFASGDEADSDDVSAICRPYLENLADMTRESVFLGIIVGTNRVLIDKLEASGRRVAHSQRGLAVPLHVGKASRILLAHLGDAEIRTYLQGARPLADYVHLFKAAGEETIDDVWADIHAAREQGYLSWRGQHEFGAVYIAFPVLDSEQRPQAVISVAGPAERMPPERVASLIPEIMKVAAEINARTALLAPLPTLLTSGVMP